MAISGATLALIVAGTAAVSAHPGDRGDQRDSGKGQAGAHAQRGGKGMFGQRGDFRSKRGDLRGQVRQGLADRLDQFVRRETTMEVEDGVLTHRVDNGSAASASEAGLEYTLATGETASVSVDADTNVIAFSEQTVERRGRSRERLVPQEIALADIEAGSDVVVWAQSTDGNDFLAQRIVVRPMADEASDASDAGETEAATDDAAAAVSDA